MHFIFQLINRKLKRKNELALNKMSAFYFSTIVPLKILKVSSFIFLGIKISKFPFANNYYFQIIRIKEKMYSVTWPY